MTKTSTIIAGHNTFITQRSLTRCTSRADKSFSHHIIRYRPVSVNCYTQSKSAVITIGTVSFLSKRFSAFPAHLYAFRIILSTKSSTRFFCIAEKYCTLCGVETVPDPLLSKLQVIAVLHTLLTLPNSTNRRCLETFQQKRCPSGNRKTP